MGLFLITLTFVSELIIEGDNHGKQSFSHRWRKRNPSV
jgi:hypothetical protein